MGIRTIVVLYNTENLAQIFDDIERESDMKLAKRISSLKKTIAVIRQFVKWKNLTNRADSTSIEPITHNLVIMPADPETIGGSRGDEAMIMSVIQHYKAIDPNYKINIIITTGEDYIKGLNIANTHIIPSYRGSYPLKNIFESIVTERPSDVVILGADCMDGHYSPYTSLILLAVFDLTSRLTNVNSHILGFSWNKKPSFFMKFAIKSVRDLKYNIRDDVSLGRFLRQIKPSNAQLVADAAFMLNPETNFDGFHYAKIWVDSMFDKKIIGFNFHPMLREYNNIDEIREDAIIMAQNLEKCLSQHNDIALFLLSHDERGISSDNTMLDIVYDYLNKTPFRSSIYYDGTVYRSTQIKGLCCLLDGLISSRMHLAIAALGQGKPLMAVSYQDKFEGLFNHFDYDKAFLMDFNEFKGEHFIQTFSKFIDELPNLTEKVVKGLPNIQRLSKRNLS